MKVVQPKVIIPQGELDRKKLILPERGGRICYQSEGKGDPVGFLLKRIKQGHESVLEHEKVSVIFICDRGVTHEIVRHRIAAYSQESTRYCLYKDGTIEFIEPFFFDKNSKERFEWSAAMDHAACTYSSLIGLGYSAQEARSVLPNSLRTMIMVTFDLREWRHFFKLRCAKAAHPQMRQLTIPLLHQFRGALPGIFDDIDWDRDFPIEHYAEVVFE